MRFEQTTERVIGAAIEVHRRLGPGLVESVYEFCLAREMELRGIPFQRQVWLPVSYREHRLDHVLRLDFLVEDIVVVELKAVERIEPVHEAQLLTYLRLSNRPVGLLMNFNSVTLRSSLRRKLNESSTQTHISP